MKWVLALCHRWRKAIAIKTFISGCMIAVFVHPEWGQLLSLLGSFVWLWVETPST